MLYTTVLHCQTTYDRALVYMLHDTTISLTRPGGSLAYDSSLCFGPNVPTPLLCVDCNDKMHRSVRKSK